MNNTITEDYCSFEVSKLLKEKGAKLQTHFNGKYHLWYYEGDLHTYEWFRSFDNMLPAPTHSLAIKWIRENFRWNIEIGYKNVNHSFISMVYPMSPNTRVHPCSTYSTHEEATEAALLYTLKNLI